MKPKILAILTCLLFFTGCASQERRVDWVGQRVDMLERRNTELEGAQKDLSTRYDHQSRVHQQTLQELREQIATLHASLERNQQEVKQLTGQLEEAEFQLRRRAQLTPEADTRVQANQQRIARIEEVLKLTPPAELMARPEDGISPEVVVPSPVPSETELYAAAKQAFDQGDLAKAREGFMELLKQYPNSANADNALFWIGETHYREKWFEKAILEYQKVIERYPKGNKVQAAMLKQGLAFFNLGDKTNARLVLRRLVDTWPDASETRIARQKLQEL